MDCVVAILVEMGRGRLTSRDVICRFLAVYVAFGWF